MEERYNITHVGNTLHPPGRIKKPSKKNLCVYEGGNRNEDKVPPFPQEGDDSTNKKTTHFIFFSIIIDGSTEN